MKERQPLVAVFFDLDGLKPINDEYGHEVGDIAIKTVADVLRVVGDEGDVATRLGGDEFLVLCSADLDLVEKKIAQVDKELVKKDKELDLPFNVRASAGYKCIIPNENFDLDALIEEADQAMYEVKKKKKEAMSLQNRKNSIL
jgi:diguanylate cyclase (GGDEF)-like protein